MLKSVSNHWQLFFSFFFQLFFRWFNFFFVCFKDEGLFVCFWIVKLGDWLDPVPPLVTNHCGFIQKEIDVHLTVSFPVIRFNGMGDVPIWKWINKSIQNGRNGLIGLQNFAFSSIVNFSNPIDSHRLSKVWNEQFSKYVVTKNDPTGRTGSQNFLFSSTVNLVESSEMGSIEHGVKW